MLDHGRRSTRRRTLVATDGIYKFEPTKPVVSSHRAVGISGRAVQLSVAVVYAFIVATIVDPLGLPPIM